MFVLKLLPRLRRQAGQGNGSPSPETLDAGSGSVDDDRGAYSHPRAKKVIWVEAGIQKRYFSNNGGRMSIDWQPRPERDFDMWIRA